MPVLVDDPAAETTPCETNTAADHSPHHPNFHHLQSSFMSSCLPISLTFMDVCYRIKIEKMKDNLRGDTISNLLKVGPTSSPLDQTSPVAQENYRTILDGITGMVAPGEVLAILGPSGSGKSTLLNALSGRLQGNDDQCFTGSVLANGCKLSKSVIKRTGFVPQDDILYPHLTVRETLIFCSLLRLPNSLSKEEKTSIVDSVITELGLEKCEKTMIGNSLVRGVSGGERKRVSIAHELLTNPSLLILDEPTSGLDSTSAYKIMSTLRSLAGKEKTVVTSLHQPSSRVYQLFDKVLVLSEGRCVYFGKGGEAMAYFESVGFSPSFPMNPADFLLDLANGVCLFDGATDHKEKSNVKQLLVSSYNKLLAPNVKAACSLEMTNSNAKPEVMKTTRTANQGELMRQSRSGNIGSSISTWFSQFTVLLQRNLKEKRHETFNSLRVFQVIAASILAGFMWWHSDSKEIQDRLGLLFFISIFWGVFPSFNAAFTFSQDRSVFIKERASGMYTLSSYFMSRTLADVPMELVLPTTFLTITYWMAGLTPNIQAFLLTLLVILGYVLVSQGLGLAIGAMIMDAKQASTVVTVTMLAFVLTGGYYVHKVPSCLGWLKYVSTTFYSYRLLIDVQYGQGAHEMFDMLGCGSDINYNKYDERATSCRFIEEDIVKWQTMIKPGMSVGVLFVMFVGYRLLAYIALRRIRGA